MKKLLLFLALVPLAAVSIFAQGESVRNALYHNEEGNALMDAGRFPEAVEAYRKSIQAYPATADTLGRTILIHNLVDALMSCGYYSEALSLTDSLPSLPLSHPIGEALLGMRAQLLSLTGRPEEALALWKSDFDAIRGSRDFCAHAQNAADVAISAGDYYWGRSVLFDALEASETAIDSLYSFRLLAVASASGNNMKHAYKMLDRAGDIVGRLYAVTDYESLMFSKTRAQILEMDGQYLAAAEEYHKSAQGLIPLVGREHPAVLSSLYGRARSLLGAGDDNRAVECYLEYADSKTRFLASEIARLNPLDLRAFWIRSREGVIDAPLFAAIADDNARGRIFDMVLLSKSFTYDCLRETSVSTSWKSIANKLPARAVAVEFADYSTLDGTPQTCAFVYAKGDKAPRFVPLPDISDLLLCFGNNPEKISEAMFDLVWTPLLKYLDGANTVFFSPSASLSGLPLEYATDLSGRLFASRYRSVLRMMTTRDAPGYKTPSAYSDLVVFGDMDYTMPTERGALLKWKPLVWSADEIDAVEQAAGPVRISVYRRRDATEKAFRSHQFEDGGGTILYMSTHGMFLDADDASRVAYFADRFDKRELEDNPLLRSVLLFSGASPIWGREGSSRNLDNDATISAQDISEMDFHGVSLVVLAACMTGNGDDDPEMFGFQRAFKLAGAGPAIVSLWPVDDEVTAKMMSSVMKYIIGGAAPEQALCRAIDEIRRTPQWESPYYWAPFVVVH